MKTETLEKLVGKWGWTGAGVFCMLPTIAMIWVRNDIFWGFDDISDLSIQTFMRGVELITGALACSFIGFGYFLIIWTYWMQKSHEDLTDLQLNILRDHITNIHEEAMTFYKAALELSQQRDVSEDKKGR